MQNNDWFEKQQKQMFRRFGVMALVSSLLSLGFFGALIYFAFWCLKHFGVIN